MAASAVLGRARPLGGEHAPPSPVAASTRTARVPWWEQAFLVVALLAQQDAFLNIPRILRGADTADPNGDVGASDPLSSLLVLVSFGVLAGLTVLRREQVWPAARRNGLSIAFAALAFLSAAWSVEAGLTVKRAFVYLVSLGLPLYMAARLGFEQGMRTAALAFAVAAAGSLAVGAAVPAWGVMHSLGLDGAWRGVFSHKNPLAQSMLIGALLEAYLIVKGPRRLFHLGVIAIELLLILLSRSTTGLVVGVSALGLFAGYLLFQRGGYVRRILTFVGPVAVAGLAVIVIFFPQSLEKASGKDATLTGRTELWAAVSDAITDRPVVGWGFQAFWQPANRRAEDLWDEIGWLAPNSHNGFLDVTLGLGALGLGLTAALVIQAFVRAGRLLRDPASTLEGAAAIMLLASVLVRSFTEAVLARQSDIDWVLFNLASFMAGGALAKPSSGAGAGVGVDQGSRGAAAGAPRLIHLPAEGEAP